MNDEKPVVLAMDALFGLPRKKSAGISYRDPLHNELFFCKQSSVDQFVEESSSNKAKPFYVCENVL